MTNLAVPPAVPDTVRELTALCLSQARRCARAVRSFSNRSPMGRALATAFSSETVALPSCNPHPPPSPCVSLGLPNRCNSENACVFFRFTQLRVVVQNVRGTPWPLQKRSFCHPKQSDFRFGPLFTTSASRGCTSGIWASETTTHVALMDSFCCVALSGASPSRLNHSHPRIQLRPLGRLLPPVARRRRIPQHLPNGFPRQPILPGYLPFALPLNINLSPNACI